MKTYLTGLVLVLSALVIGCSKSNDDDNGNNNGNGNGNSNNPPVVVVSGTLDSTFGTMGKKTVSITQNDDARAIAIQPDGKIIAAGFTKFNTATIHDFALVRLDTNGTVDNSFGTNGIVTTDFDNTDDKVTSLAIQPDGKIVVVGFIEYQFSAIARYNANGSLDNSFGTNGKIIGTSNPLYSIAAVAIQNGNKIIVAGSAWNPSTFEMDFALQRYNSNGTLDNSFGSSGSVATAFGSAYDEAKSLIIQQDGKILVCGYSATSSSKDNFAIARYNADGSLDNSFGNGGKVSTSVGIGHEIANSVGVQSDGKIILAGYINASGSYQRFGLVRYNTNGTLDNSFGNAGKVETEFQSGINIGRSLVVQPDNKLVVCGYTTSGVAYSADYALARYNSNGSLDSTYGTNGKVRTDFDSGWDEGFSIAQQTDGKIVAVGTAVLNGGNFSFAFARYKK